VCEDKSGSYKPAKSAEANLGFQKGRGVLSEVLSCVPKKVTTGGFSACRTYCIWGLGA